MKTIAFTFTTASTSTTTPTRLSSVGRPTAGVLEVGRFENHTRRNARRAPRGD